VDLATFSIYSIDALSHRFWQFHEPAAFEEPPTDADVGRFRNVVTDAYRDVDRVVGELLEAVGEGTVVVALSDHGFQALQSGGHSLVQPRTARLEERLVQAVGPLDLTRLGGRMVLVPGDGQEAAVRAFFAELLDGSGAPVFRVESLGRDREGLGLVLAKPEVDLDRLKNDTVGGEPLSDYVRVKPDFTGEHHPDGIFWARGPGIPTGSLGTVSLLDVAPTLLSLMDIAPDPELPGRAVLGGAGSRVVESGELLERQQWLDGRAGVNEERLRALGYVE
jgi:arylsulfatase A-like enzyme